MHPRWPLVAIAAALALVTAPAAFGATDDPPASAGWHGREIRDPLPRSVSELLARFPRGWSAGAAGRGTGYASRNGSLRVREVQRRLWRRGYRPGPVDGRFGPRTRAAVIWFQTKHGLPRTGRVDARSVATLREARRPSGAPAATVAPSPPGVTDATGAFAGTPTARPEPSDSTWLVGLAVVLTFGLAAIAAWLRSELQGRPAQPAEVRERPRAGNWDERPAQLTAAAPALARGPASIVGYVAIASGEDRDLDIDAQRIGAWCEGRGWHLTRIVHDTRSGSGRLTSRPGLAWALDQIAGGRAAGIVLARLGDLTHSAAELAQLLQWIDKAEAFVIALDQEPDTLAAGGDLSRRGLLEVGNWERGGIVGRELGPAPTTRENQG
jgi:peptidoglycan hydrolase-like protein with peptidoglycan-binding domain